MAKRSAAKRVASRSKENSTTSKDIVVGKCRVRISVHVSGCRDDSQGAQRKLMAAKSSGGTVGGGGGEPLVSVDVYIG